MSELDALIYKAGALALILSCINRRAIVPAFLICTSFALNELFYIERVSWVTLEAWATKLMIKDFVIMIVFGFRQKTAEIVLMAIFAVSCLFHLFMRIEIYNHILDMKHIRAEIVTYITVAQLATMYLILFTGGDWNGGKRARSYIRSRYFGISHIFYNQVYKVKS